jgi:hypothetical protein
MERITRFIYPRNYRYSLALNNDQGIGHNIVLYEGNSLKTT